MSDLPLSDQFVLLNDQPVSQLDSKDVLGIAREVTGLANMIMGSRYSAPFTVGIDADWGMGKSTLMLQLQAALDAREKEGVVTKWFNAWTAQKDDALAGLIKSALMEVDERSLRRLLRRITRNRSLLIGLRVTFIVAASFLHLGGVVDQLWEFLSVDARSRNEIRKDLQEVFDNWAAKTKRTPHGRLLVVFVDDLDRCSSEVIIRACEAIRLYLAVPGVVFVIGCDQEVLTRAAQRSGMDSQAATTLGFLEKIIQITYHKLAPDDEQINGLVKYYAELSGAGDLFSPQARQIVMQGTGRNPRRVKRLLNSIILQYRLDPEWETLGSENLSSVNLLAHFYPEFYRELTRPNSKDIIHKFLTYKELLDRMQRGDSVRDQDRLFFTDNNAVPPAGDGPDSREAIGFLETKLPSFFPSLAGQQEFVQLLSELAVHPRFAELMDWLQRRAPARAAGFAVRLDEGSGHDGLAVTAFGTIQSVPDREEALASVRLAPRPAVFVGRDELLEALHARLKEAADGPRVAVLCGLGGIGKTSAAVEYAYQHLAEVAVAWEFSADDPAVLAAGFAELAAQLRGSDMGDLGEPVASVHGVLAALPVEWLLIFDNAMDFDSVRAFLPPAGNGRVVITSRNQNWPATQALNVSVMAAGVSAGFLATQTKDSDSQAALELAVELGGLPLALEQAAAYIQATGGSLASYLTSFRQRRDDLLARGEPVGYTGTVTTTWSLALRELEQSAPGAVGLLRLLASCAPAAVPLHVLLQARPTLADGFGPEVAPVLVPLLEDQLAASDAVAALGRYSLVAPAGDGLVLVHRLVQAVTADQMPTELRKAWRGAAAVLIEAAIPADTDRPESWPACAVLLPHAQAALANDSDGMARLANYLGARGSYAAALELQQRILNASERSRGLEHPETLTARANLAYWTGRAGDPAAARDQYAALLPIRERVSGAEHRETLIARGNLALWTGMAGDAASSRDHYAVLLPVFERVLGVDHPDTLAARGNLARWTGEAGDAASARDQYAVLLPVLERVLGADHPDTLAARHNLALFTGAAGDAASAHDQYAALLPLFERVVGVDHPDTLAARGNLARWTGEAGDAASARDQYAVLLPVLERVLGADHPDTLAARHNLALFTGAAGDAASAHDQYVALLPVRERVLGTEHPDTLTERGNLARSTGERGDTVGARDQYAVLLPVFERVVGVDHPDTLAARGNLARWTGEAGDAASARDQYAVLLPVLERVLGADHPDTLAARHNLALFTGAAGDAASAHDQYAALLPLYERVLGAEYPAALATRANLAYWTGEAGDAASARDQYAVLLPVLERVLGADHPDTLAARGSLALFTGAAGDTVGARDQYAVLLPVLERVLGADHPGTLTTRNNLASFTGEAGDAASARDQYAALLPIRERVLGPTHPDTMTTRANLDYWAKRADHEPGKE